MVPNARLRGLMFTSAAALAGVAIGAVVIRAIEPSPRETSREPTLASAAAASLPPFDRLAFVPRGTLPPTALPPEDENSEMAGVRMRPAPPGGWAAATVTESAAESGWRLMLAAPATGPSAAPKREAPRRVYTLKTRLAEISVPALARLSDKFQAAKAPWPPAQIALLALKDEKVLELHSRQVGGSWQFVHRYRVLAASGQQGPKLRQGDKQVPEGIYGIESLNPNSAYHVSLRVNYPNPFDRSMAARDGRKDLGGDIMIHGKNLSAGCLAIGDEAVEELFVLAAQTGLQNIRLIIAPRDFRAGAPSTERAPDQPEWLPKLYAEVAGAMAELPAARSSSPGLLSYFFK